MTSAEIRHKLLQMFWGMINTKLGGDKDIAYDLLDNMYPKAKRSTKRLTIDELAVVVRALARHTKTRINLDWLYTDRELRQQGKPPRSKRSSVPEPVTQAQILLILDLAAQMPIKYNTLAAMIQKAAQGNDVMTVPQAQALIEALKSMRDRGWQETRPDTHPTTSGTPPEEGIFGRGVSVSWYVPPNSRTTH